MKQILIILCLLVVLIPGCIPQFSDSCIDEYYEVLDSQASRDEAARAFWACQERRE